MNWKKLIAMLGMIVLLVSSSMNLNGCRNKHATANLPQENGTIEVLFSQTDNCEARLEQILNASSKIEAALYDLDVAEIINILKAKSADVLVDEDNYFDYGTKISGTGLMHDKFWVLKNASGIDYIITGSLNPTYNDLKKNDNNVLIISSKYLEKNYEAEFKELKNNEKDKPTQYQKIILNNQLIENYFCPDDNCEDKVLIALKKANQSIYFMTFSFTSDPLGDYIISKKDKLDIKGVFDESQANSQKQYTEYYKMLNNSMKVKLDSSKYKLHHKVFIIDNQTVITGSYNPTSSGTERNDENILIIHDSDVAAKFMKEFERVWNTAKH